MIRGCCFFFKSSPICGLAGFLAQELSDKGKVGNELSSYKFFKLCRGTVVATMAGDVQVA